MVEQIHQSMSAPVGPTARIAVIRDATLPFILAVADKGSAAAMLPDPHLLAGLNVYRGRITHPAVAAALGVEAADPHQLLAR